MYRENEKITQYVTHDFDTTIRQTLLAIGLTQKPFFVNTTEKYLW